MSEDTREARRLDRRGFLGAAAGVAAAGAAASPMAWAGKSKSAADSCAEVPGTVPKARRGAIHFSFNAAAWNTVPLFENDWLPLMKQINCNAWEFAGNYPTVVPPRTGLPNGITGNGAGTGVNTAALVLEGWTALGSYAKTYGFRVVGTHDGPAPTTANNLGSALTKMNAWGCNHLGAGSGYPSGSVNLPNAGTAITNPSAISAWQASAATMNSWGQAYQTNSGAGVLGITPYGPGVFGGTALTSGRSCARYYRHFHSEQGKWIQNTGTKYDNHYISEVIYTETDLNVAFAESDQCWLLDGLWMSGGSAPSVGIQGAGDPNPGEGRNRLVQPDIVERYQDRIGQFHIKDLGPNDQGTQVRNVGDESSPGAATYPYGAVPWATDGSQDTVQFQKIYERFRHPEAHEYLFERDGMSNTVTAGNYYKKCYVQALDMMDKLVLDRSPTVVRKPYKIPATTDGVSVWGDAAHSWLPYATGVDPAHPLYSNARPPAGKGAPGPECPPETNGENRVGAKIRVDRKGTWSRHSSRADSFTYQWLRDGAPAPLYNGAEISTKPGCTVDANSNIYYIIQPEDAGHKLSCQVTVVNDEDSASNVTTEQVQVLGRKTDAQVESMLLALEQQVRGMHLGGGAENVLTQQIDALRKRVLNGENPCASLDAISAKIADYNTRGRITNDQMAQLNASIQQIKTAVPC